MQIHVESALQDFHAPWSIQRKIVPHLALSELIHTTVAAL